MAESTTHATDRLGLEVLTPDECWNLVGQASVGRVAFVEAGEPMILPVTHSVHGRQIVFLAARGTKLEAAERAQSFAFEVDDWNTDQRSGWSVLVRGVGEPVYDDDEIIDLDTLGVEPWLEAAEHGTWIRIRADEISGRRLQS